MSLWVAKGLLSRRAKPSHSRLLLQTPQIFSSALLAIAVMSAPQLFSSSARAGGAIDVPSRASQPAAIDGNLTRVSLIDLVKSSRSPCIVVSNALIRCDGPLELNSLTRTLVNGDGVHIEFTNSLPKKGGILLHTASEVVLSHFEISWLGGGARDPILRGVQRIQSLGQVIACAAHEQGGAISLDLPLEGAQPIGSISVWDDSLGWPWYPSAPITPEVSFPTGTSANFSAGRSGCSPRLAAFVGHRILLRHLKASDAALECSHCSNITVEEVRITSAPGMGFVFNNDNLNISLIGNRIEPRCAPDCSLAEPSIAADAAHFSDATGEILIEGNDFGWQGDDGINVTGSLVPATLGVREAGTERWLTVSETWRARLDLLAVGDSVQIFNEGLSSLGQAEVLALEPAAGRLLLSWLPPGQSNLVLARSDEIPRNVVIRGNYLHDNRARAILIGGSDALIEHNTINRVTMEAILVPADTNTWYEGPGAQDVKITSNIISDVNRYPAAPYPSAISAGVSINPIYVGVVGTPIKNIEVKGNAFSNVYSNASRLVSIGRGVSETGGQVNP